MKILSTRLLTPLDAYMVTKGVSVSALNAFIYEAVRDNKPYVILEVPISDTHSIEHPNIEYYRRWLQENKWFVEFIGKPEKVPEQYGYEREFNYSCWVVVINVAESFFN